MPLRFSSAGRKAGQFASDYYSKLPGRLLAKVSPAHQRRYARTRSSGWRGNICIPISLVILAVGDVDTMLRGNPDRPQYSIAKLAGDRGVTRIPLPDPLTMVYPTAN